MRRLANNLLLALGSLAVGLVLCEAALRVFHPRYEYAAAPPQRSYRWQSRYPHPDNRATHLVVYNNLGSRQHRDFSDRDLAEGVNLAFFGDSYTENLRLAAHHSFTAEHRLVVYVKDPCDERKPAAGIFLHVRPFNIVRMLPSRRPHGRIFLHPRAPSPYARTPRGSECVFAVSLPQWLIATARTGQYASGEVLWEGVFSVDNAEEWHRVRSVYRRQWRALVESEPSARSVWNVHMLSERRELAFLKAPCRVDDTMGVFFARTLPVREPNVDEYVETLFDFESGVRLFAARFDDRCLMTRPLPAGGIGAVWVGERARDTGALRWEARFYWDVDGLRRTYASVSGRRPDAAGAFDVYRRDDALVYVREPCAEADTRHRFFLHVYAAQSKDGHDSYTNLDFDFGERGARLDGRCVAVAPLPETALGARLRTGQFSSAGAIWAVAVAQA